MHSYRTREPRPSRIRQACQRGFTLLELMVTLTVAGVLLSVGVPSFFDVIRNSRAATNANELVTALSVARSEAIRRGARVSVCASSNGTSCSGGWVQGWIVVVDSAPSDTVVPVIANAATDVLRVWPAPAGNPTITVGSSWVRFLPRGEARAQVMPLTYTMKIAGCAAMQGRSIGVNAVGRTTVARVACP